MNKIDFKLTDANYHSLEAERLFMGRSQYKGFLECESMAMAMLSGAWVEPTTDAFLVGSYVHAWCEGKRREFIDEHPEMFTKSGDLKAQFKTADKMIATLEDDELCMYMLQGEKEVILTAEFAGAVWKIKIDVLNRDRKRMVDLKTTRSIREYQWNDKLGGKTSFVEMYDYLLQAALYCEIERRSEGRDEKDWLDNYAVAVSKDNVPDKEVIDLRDPDRYVEELNKIEVNMPRILDVKAGRVEPNRCEDCDWCRATKKLRGAVHYSEL